MNFGSTLGRATVLATLLGLASLQAGCSAGAGAEIASMISLTNAHDVMVSVNQKISEGKFRDALEEGASFLKDNEDESGQLAWALARASAQLGNHEQAIHYASLAVKADAVSKVQLMSEPMLEPLRSDVRYTSFVSGGDAARAQAIGAASAPR